jgi:hypothetical protein
LCSKAPRSSKSRGPAPVLGVAGSSTRAVLSRSVSGWLGAAESAESMAGDPLRRWKSPAEGATHIGSAWIPCCSCPVAVRKAARDE